MPEWVVTFTAVERSAATAWMTEDRAQRNRDAPGTVVVYGDPSWTRIFADELTVEGGALVFWKEGKVSEVYGPSSYKHCMPG